MRSMANMISNGVESSHPAIFRSLLKVTLTLILFYTWPQNKSSGWFVETSH